MSVQNKNYNLKHLTIEQVIQKSSLRKAIQNVFPSTTQKNKNALLGHLKSKQLNTLDLDLNQRNKKNLITNQLYTIMKQTSRTSLSSSKANTNAKKYKHQYFLKKERKSETLDPQLMIVQQKKQKDKDGLAQNKDKRKKNQFIQANFLCVKNGKKTLNSLKQTIQQQDLGNGKKKTIEEYELKNYRTQLHFTGEPLYKQANNQVIKSQNVTGRSHKVFSSQLKKGRSLLLNKYDLNDAKYNEIKQPSKRMTSFNSFQRSSIKNRRCQKSRQKIIQSLTSKTIDKQDRKKYEILVYNFPSQVQQLQCNKRIRIKTTEIDKLRSPVRKVQIQNDEKHKCKVRQSEASLRSLESKIDSLPVKKNIFLIPEFLKPSLQLFKIENPTANKGKKFQAQVQEKIQQGIEKQQQIQIKQNQSESLTQQQNVQIEQGQQQSSQQVKQKVVQVTSRKLIPLKKQRGQTQQSNKKIGKNSLHLKSKLKDKVIMRNKNQFAQEQQLCGWRNYQQQKEALSLGRFDMNLHTQQNDIFQ